MSTTTQGYTMLMIRVQESDFEGAKLALEKYPNENINDQNKHGNTALALAARSGNCMIAQYLLSKGADINLANKTGQTPLFIACSYNHLELSKILIKSGANLNYPDSRGWTPLMSACQNSNMELVELLLKYEADVRPIDRFGKTASQRTKDPQIIKILVEIENKIDLIEEATSFSTPKKKEPRHASQDQLTNRKSYARTHRRTQGKEENEKEIRNSNTIINSDLDQTLRACPEFVQDMEIYKMHKKVGYYKYLKGTDPRNLYVGDLSMLNKEKRGRSLGRPIDPKSTQSSQKIKNIPKENLDYRNNQKENSKFNDIRLLVHQTVEKKRYQNKEDDEPGTSRPVLINKTNYVNKSQLFEINKKDPTTKENKKEEHLAQLKISKVINGNLKSKQRSTLKSKSKLLERFTLDKGESGEVLNHEVRDLFRLFIEKLCGRTKKILIEKVAKAIKEETEKNEPLSEEKLVEIISNVTTSLEGRTLLSFRDLLMDLIKAFPFSHNNAKTVETGTEGLICQVRALTQKEILIDLYNSSQIDFIHRRSRNPGTGDMKITAERIKEAINNKIDEILQILNETLADKTYDEKIALKNRFRDEILETLDSTQFKVRGLNGREQFLPSNLESETGKREEIDIEVPKVNNKDSLEKKNNFQEFNIINQTEQQECKELGGSQKNATDEQRGQAQSERLLNTEEFKKSERDKKINDEDIGIQEIKNDDKRGRNESEEKVEIDQVEQTIKESNKRPEKNGVSNQQDQNKIELTRIIENVEHLQHLQKRKDKERKRFKLIKREGRQPFNLKKISLNDFPNSKQKWNQKKIYGILSKVKLEAIQEENISDTESRHSTRNLENIQNEPLTSKSIKEETKLQIANDGIYEETLRKAIIRRHLIAKAIRSLKKKVCNVVPIPAPSRTVRETLKMVIDEIPYCENFHYPGQSFLLKAKLGLPSERVLLDGVKGMDLKTNK